MNEFGGHPDQHFGHISYSQQGEDFMILNLFRQIGIEKPSYLDLGACHPTYISNTKLMYERGCRGVNVEANPSLIENFTRDRPEDITLQFGVGLSPGKAIFHMYDHQSGRNTFSQKEVARFEEESVFRIKQRLLLGVVTLSYIVREYCSGVFPDFLNCDIEGMDYEILECADFSASQPKIVCMEVRKEDVKNTCHMMCDQGFYTYCRMGENIIFFASHLKSKLFPWVE